MHEMGITQGIVDAAVLAAQEAGLTRITQVNVTIGELSEIVDFALQFAFEALTAGTMAEGAELVVKHVGAASKCNDCGATYKHDRFQMLCMECGSLNVTLLSGRELQIDSIEADEGEECPPETGAQSPSGPAPNEE